MVVHDNLKFLSLVGLMQDGLDHCTTFLEVLISLSCHEDIQGLIVPFLSVIDLRAILCAISTD